LILLVPAGNPFRAMISSNTASLLLQMSDAPNPGNQHPVALTPR
jgi:hypothetical protein